MADGVDTIELEDIERKTKSVNHTNPIPDDRRFGKTDKQRMAEWMEEMKKPKPKIVYAPDK